MKKKVMITGGAGFIGFHLAKRLIDCGYEVDLVDNFSRGIRDQALERLLSFDGVRLLDRDLMNNTILKTEHTHYTSIFHLAAIVGVKNVLRKPFDVLYHNAITLLNIIDIARRQRSLERFVFFSTSEVYAGTLQHFELQIPTPEISPLTLTEIGQPRTSYMLSKIYGEALCHQSAVPFTIIRPHNIYGPRMGMAHVIPELLRKAHESGNGQKIDVFSVTHKRTFCFVDDAVEMIRIAAESPSCSGETINIGNQEPEITIRELADYVLEVTGKNLGIIAGPDDEGSPIRRCPDMSKTFALTGYKSRTDLLQGMKLTYQWYRENVFGRDGVTQ